MAISRKYADFASGLQFENLPPEVVQQAKMLIMDLLGVSLAGRAMMEFPRLVMDYFATMGGTPEATIITSKQRIPAINAAFVNACCAHALDMDDGHRFAALHPGSAIIPAALAAAELAGAGTKDLIAGIVAGYEIMIRIGIASRSSLTRGFHLTGIAGVFGAAAASGRILGLSQAEMTGAFGMAGLQASGLLQVNLDPDGAKVKPMNPAKAAMSGLFSCALAQRGQKGPRDIFEGRLAYLTAFTDGADAGLLTKGLGTEFEILNIYLKLYASCRHTHAPIEAAMNAFRLSEVDCTEIERILVETYRTAIETAGQRIATTPSSGRFSIPFSVALALVKQDAGADRFCDETVGDEQIQALAKRIDFCASAQWEACYPKKRGATVTLWDRGGRSWSSEVGLPKGEPENPASREEIEVKFYQNASAVLPRETSTRLGETIMSLENRSLSELIDVLREDGVA